jgi:multidrug efflux system membrane fusion protein
MYVTAALQLPPEPAAIVVPATAIQTSAAGENVIVVRGPDARREGVAAIVPVQTGRRIGDDVVITGGLKPGEMVVTAGQLRLQPGAKVKVAAPRATATPVRR